MSSEHPYLEGGQLVGQPLSVSLAAGETVEFTVTLADINGNALPAGTEVAVNITESENLSATPSSITIPSATEAQSFTVRVRGTDEEEAPTGFLFFDITGPKGLNTQTDPTFIN